MPSDRRTRSRSRSRDRRRSRSSSRDRDSKRRRYRSRTRSRSRSRDRVTRDRRSPSRSRSRSRERERSRRDRSRSRSRSRDRDYGRSRSSYRSPPRRVRSPSPPPYASSASSNAFVGPAPPPPPPPGPAPEYGYSNGGDVARGASPPPPTTSAGGRIDFDQYNDIPVETSGRDCPAPIDSFTDAALGPELLSNIQRVKYNKPTPVQKYAIPIVLSGRDLMGCAQTGSGKTAAFLFPSLALLLRQGRKNQSSRDISPSLLVLAPTRELAMQICEEAKRFTYNTFLKVCIVYGGAPMGGQLRELERGCDILIGTPGRLNDIMGRGKVRMSGIKFLILDEADRMLDMGFEPQIRRIVEQADMPRTGHRRTLMFSATFPKEIQRLAASFLYDYIFLAVGRVGSATELVKQHFVRVEDSYQKQSILLQLLKQNPGGLTLVFTETKRECSSLAHYLYRQGYPATSIHGDRTQQEREAALRSFGSGATPILVATNVAARGLDINDITHVVNYDMPNDVDEYVHRIGRTGRAGKKGLATSMIPRDGTKFNTKLLELLNEAKQEIPDWLMQMRPTGFQFKDRGAKKHNFGGRDFRRKESGYDFGSSSHGSSASSYGAGASSTYSAQPAMYAAQPAAAAYPAAPQAPANTAAWAAYMQSQYR